MDSVALQQIGDAVPAAMLVLDREARVVMANAAAVEMLGPGLTDRPFVTVLRQPLVNRAVDQVLAAAQVPAPARLPVGISARGRERKCLVTVSPLTLSTAATSQARRSGGVFCCSSADFSQPSAKSVVPQAPRQPWRRS